MPGNAAWAWSLGPGTAARTPASRASSASRLVMRSTSWVTVVAPQSPGPGRSLRFSRGPQAPVMAAEVEQRVAVGAGPLDPADPAQEHRVVAAVVGRLDHRLAHPADADPSDIT